MVDLRWVTGAALFDSRAAAGAFLSALARGDELLVGRLLHRPLAAELPRGDRVAGCLAILMIDRAAARALAADFDRRLIYRRVSGGEEAVLFGLAIDGRRTCQLRMVHVEDRWMALPLRPESRWERLHRTMGRRRPIPNARP